MSIFEEKAFSLNLNFDRTSHSEYEQPTTFSIYSVSIWKC